MPSKKKLTLNTPEPGLVATHIKLSTLQIDVESGRVTGSYCKCTDANEVKDTGRIDFILPDINLANVEAEIIAAADFAGELPDGMIEDV